MNDRANRLAALVGVGVSVSILVLSAGSTAVAQNIQRSRAIANSEVLSQISMFSYEARRRSQLNLRPTPLIANGDGEVDVEYEDGNASISIEVDDMPPPTGLGPYTTYIAWALTPDGRASNLGVLTGPDGEDGELETQYSGSQFALIVTAEPHFAVSSPSTMIALYNVPDDVRGTETRVSTLTEQVDYSALTPIEVDDRSNPVELVQAEYAIAIAESAQAGTYASSRLGVANERLAAARTGWTEGNRGERREALVTARGAVEQAEDALRAALIASADAEAEARRRAAADEAAAAERALAQAAAAEAATQAALAADLAAEAAASRAQAAAQQQLVDRLNAALPTRETDRGLVSEIGGVQFVTGSADLNASARESLARFAGIVASYPDLSFTIEGHTDNVGNAANNRELSLRRAISVRDYLIGQGVGAPRIDVEGFGFDRPVADNDTPEGRARNRRVEIVITGGPIVP